MKKYVIPVMVLCLTIKATKVSQGQAVAAAGAAFSIGKAIKNGAEEQEKRVWRAKMLTNTVQGVEKARKSLKEFRKFTREVKKVKSTVEDLYSLQEAIREGKISVDGVNGLQISNVMNLVENVMCIDLDPENYVPDFNYSSEIKLSLRNQIGSCGSMSAYNNTYGSYVTEWLNEGSKRNDKESSGSFDGYSGYSEHGGSIGSTRTGKSIQEVTNEINAAKKDMDRALMQELATKEMANKVKVRAAGQYVEIADKLAERAVEMAEALKTEGDLKMSEGERLSLLAKSSDYALKALDYKVKAAEYMKQAAQKDERYEEVYENYKRKLALQLMASRNQ